MAIAVKKPKVPKLKKLPKKPKRRTLDSMKDWEKRAKAVKSENDKKTQQYNRDLKSYNAEVAAIKKIAEFK